MKKAQSAMEYLMTYGWAILIVIIVAAALFALGVFNPATYTQSTATGFTGFQIPSGGWQFTSGGVLTLQLKNMAGANINITSIQATYAGTVGTNATASNAIGPGSAYTEIVTVAGVTPATGSSYSVDVVVSYTNLDTGLAFTSSGKVTGTVSS
jgi:hypothetical protein